MHILWDLEQCGGVGKYLEENKIDQWTVKILNGVTAFHVFPLVGCLLLFIREDCVGKKMLYIGLLVNS